MTPDGRPVLGFAFLDIDHAAENGAAAGRLVACKMCVAKTTRALQDG